MAAKQQRKDVQTRRHNRKPHKDTVASELTGAERNALDVELQSVDIITFAEDYLGVDFTERPAQRVILKGIYGLHIDTDRESAERKTYQALTGFKQMQPGRGTEALEFVLCLGARSGKSFLSSIIALYEAICRSHKWRRHLMEDEVGYAMIIATKKEQAVDIIQRNATRLLQNAPKLRHYIDRDPLVSTLRLTNGMRITSLPCTSRSGRGFPIFCLIMDEIGHFYTEGARADKDILGALSPRLAQFPGAKRGYISTPSAKQGLFWELFDEGFKIERRTTFKAESIFMNPKLDIELLKREQQRDPENYAREFLAEFAEKVAAYFPYEKLQTCFVLVGDMAVREGVQYHAAIDQSGLAGRDRFSFGIAHRDQGRQVVLDAIRSWDTCDINDVLPEIVALMRRYRLARLLADQYAAGWVRNAFAEHGIEVELAPRLPQVYANTKGLVIAGNLQLPDNLELKDGLSSTQAYYGRNNSLSIAHERSVHGHADMADAACRAIWSASMVPEEPDRIEVERFNGILVHGGTITDLDGGIW